ncbi:MAG TPA: hypothetical protein VFW73_06980 [Lacipirellulaceae bacterium]|nr:hypothetical protein [Lacipirellulaceae bacterium]
MSKERKMENPMGGDLAPPPDRQYYSVGFVCQMIQQPPDFVHRLMRLADVEFAWAENGVGVIRGDHLQKMASMLADVREAVEDSQAKCQAAPNN